MKNSHSVQYCKMQHRYTMYIIKRLNGLNINAADKTSLTLCLATLSKIWGHAQESTIGWNQFKLDCQSFEKQTHRHGLINLTSLKTMDSMLMTMYCGRGNSENQEGMELFYKFIIICIHGCFGLFSTIVKIIW